MHMRYVVQTEDRVGRYDSGNAADFERAAAIATKLIAAGRTPVWVVKLDDASHTVSSVTRHSADGRRRDDMT